MWTMTSKWSLLLLSGSDLICDLKVVKGHIDPSSSLASGLRGYFYREHWKDLAVLEVFVLHD